MLCNFFTTFRFHFTNVGSLPEAKFCARAGKLGVSNSVLDKPGKLDRDEWTAVLQHTQHTEAILSRIGAFGELARVASAHHERLDGTGYPRGLKAQQISIETRIITTADIFDAISADRPYRGAVPIPETLKLMSETVGTAIDPACFEALERVACSDIAAKPLSPQPWRKIVAARAQRVSRSERSLTAYSGCSADLTFTERLRCATPCHFAIQAGALRQRQREACSGDEFENQRLLSCHDKLNSQ